MSRLFHDEPMRAPSFMASMLATGAQMYALCRTEGHDMIAVQLTTDAHPVQTCLRCPVRWEPVIGFYESARAVEAFRV